LATPSPYIIDVMKAFDRFWHGTFKRPFRLAKVIDEGQGDPVLLLHGIGRSGKVWQHLVAALRPTNRVLALDLLGFGASPKPDWLDYNIDDHASAVIASLQKLRLGPVVLVGHSMGCLVAVRVARMRPDLVRHLVLYEMPLYEGLPKKRIYKLRLNLYFRLYQRIISYQPTFDAVNARRAEKMARKIPGFEVTRETWLPFVRSLENTIMHQTASEDIKQIQVPMDVIFGTLDMLVIRGKPQKIFGADTANITAHTIRARHVISPKASLFLAERVKSALSGETKKAIGG
jgi:pimeloyl-ACP methyl ester carboxylesterase